MSLASKAAKEEQPPPPRRLRELWSRARALWAQAKRERGTPRELALAVAVGVFVGCSPALGIHGLVAVGAATALRLNRLWAWIGSRLSNMITLPFVVYVQIQVAHRLRTGTWMELEREHIVDQVGALLGDWLLGLVTLGTVISMFMGLLAYVAFVARDRRRARATADADRG